MWADLSFFLLDGIKYSRDAVTDLFLQDELAETDSEQDADSGKNKIQNVRMLEVDAQYQIADAVRRFLDDDGGQTSQETRGHTEQQHELLVGQMGCPPFIQTLDPIAELLL